MMTHDIFISYANADKLTADAICAKLEERGLRCWIAPRDILPGMNYASSIVKAIDESRAIVLVFSSNSNVSAHITREVERAVHNGIPIVPVRIEVVEPSNELSYFLGSQHWLDAMTPPLDRHLSTIAETLSFLVGRPSSSEIVSPSIRKSPAPPPARTSSLSSLRSYRVVITVLLFVIVLMIIGYFALLA